MPQEQHQAAVQERKAAAVQERKAVASAGEQKRTAAVIQTHIAGQETSWSSSPQESKSPQVLGEFYTNNLFSTAGIATFPNSASFAALGLVGAKSTPPIPVDVDELMDFSSSWDIRATPTFFFVKNGKQVDKLVGANKPELEKKVAALADGVGGK